MADSGTPPASATGSPPASATGSPLPAGTSADARQPGIREVLLVATAVVLTVFVAAAATALLPREGQALVFDTPLLIVVLIAGTAIVLWRILRPPGT